MCYSWIIAYDISVLEYIGVSIVVIAGFFVLSACFAVLRKEYSFIMYNCIVFTIFNTQNYHPLKISAWAMFLKYC